MDGGRGATDMTCEEAEVLLHALIDGELDAGHAREVEAHVATCARCAAQLAAFRDLQRSLRGAELGHAAPVTLRARIDRAVPQPVAGPSRRALIKSFVAGGV